MADNANEMMEALSKQLRMPPEQIRASCERGDTGALLEHVDGGRAKQVESILSDPEKAKALLDSPQARALLKLLRQQ